MFVNLLVVSAESPGRRIALRVNVTADYPILEFDSVQEAVCEPTKAISERDLRSIAYSAFFIRLRDGRNGSCFT